MPKGVKQEKTGISSKQSFQNEPKKKWAGKLSNTIYMKSTTNVVIGVLVLVVLTTGGAAAYFYNQLQQDPQVQVQEEIDKLVAQVGELLVLPEGEAPTIATVSDVNLLGDQPFFANANNGDRVLIYTSARKAILYDPIANKIVEIAPIILGENQINPPESEVITEPTPEPTSEPSEEQ